MCSSVCVRVKRAKTGGGQQSSSRKVWEGHGAQVLKESSKEAKVRKVLEMDGMGKGARCMSTLGLRQIILR